jgi:hypothetical protein
MFDIHRDQMTGPSPPADGPEKITLDTTPLVGYNSSMPPIADILKEAIRTCGLSDRKLESLSGVNRNSICRFMRGSTGLSLEQADMLVEFFGIELHPRDHGCGKGKK